MEEAVDQIEAGILEDAAAKNAWYWSIIAFVHVPIIYFSIFDLELC